MKIRKEDVPVTLQAPGTIMRAQPNYGSMTAAFNELAKGTDFTPLLAGLEHNSCHCPHWGYILEGALVIKYDSSEEEILKAGDIFYLPPGHTAIVEENVKFVDFSPTKELNEVMAHVANKMAELSA